MSEEFKAKQKVWWYDNAAYAIKPGVLVSAEDQSDRDELPTFHIRTEELYGTTRILQDWVFHTKEEGIKFMKQKLSHKILMLKSEIARVDRILKEL